MIQRREDRPASLEDRLGHAPLKQRVEMENDDAARHFGEGITLFGSLYLSAVAIRSVLEFTGLYQRGSRNAGAIRVKENVVKARMPPAFDGFTILHLSDLHVDLNQAAMQNLIGVLQGIECDICVLTGDYRGKSSGPVESALAGMAQILPHIAGPTYGVLGDHDTIGMVPGLEAMGVRMLLNERETIMRGAQMIHLAGIDDAHRYLAADIERAARGIPRTAFSILLSHTPEVYRQAAHAGFKLMLSGHTHGGQICLPFGIPVTLEAILPRRMGSGPWKYEDMVGYTSRGTGSSIIPVRFNCPPEITLHRLEPTKADE